MKVHVMFSLNVTCSFADAIIYVVSGVRYLLHGKLSAKNVLEIIRHRTNINKNNFSHFIAEKNSFV